MISCCKKNEIIKSIGSIKNKMELKIKSHFINNIDLKFEKIKKEYVLSKNTYQMKSISFINILLNQKIKNNYLRKYVSFLVEKYDLNCIKKVLNDLDENFIKILNIKNMNDNIFLYENYKFENFLKYKNLKKSQKKYQKKITKEEISN